MKFSVPILAMLTVVLVAVPGASGSNCRYAAPYKAQQVYAAPVYQQTYVVQDYNTVLVPKAFQVAVSQGFYMGISDEARFEAFTERIAEKLARITETQRQYLLANPNLGPAPAQLPLSAAPTTKIGAILATRCTSCHSPTGSRPQTDLTGDPDKIPEVLRLKALQQITLGKMPKGKPPIPQDEFNEIGAWSEKHPVHEPIPLAAPMLPKEKATLPPPPPPEKKPEPMDKK